MVKVRNFLETIHSMDDNWTVILETQSIPLPVIKGLLEKMDEDAVLELDNRIPYWYLTVKHDSKEIIVNTKNNIDLKNEINNTFESAINGEMSELDAFMYLMENGVTLEDFEKIGKGDYAKSFMKDHGLL